jgi:site-specific DNA-methyltransferase (adenine-specific)
MHDYFYATPESNNGHPCPKPIKWAKILINKTKSQSTIDPFMGSGTTLVAAKELGRKAIGIEIEEKYCEIAVRRLQQDVFQWAKDKTNF